VGVTFRGPVPPDNPLFSLGPSFAFCYELPEDDGHLTGQATRFLARLQAADTGDEQQPERD
jgi:hypothetical protein